jgi:hypothetical protein
VQEIAHCPLKPEKILCKQGDEVWHITCVQELWDREDGSPWSFRGNLSPLTSLGIQGETMRKLAAVLFLAAAAQCQTTRIQQLTTAATVSAPDTQDVSKTLFSNGGSLNTAIVAQLEAPLTATPISEAVGGSVTAGGRPIIKTAVIKPAKISTVNDHAARNSRVWYSLVVFSHASAGFDAYSTRQAIGHGGVELNPFLKPFADSAAIYPALQVWPTAMDFAGSRMMHSQNRFLRKVWWVPQAASTAAFLSFGSHNLGVHAQ